MLYICIWVTVGFPLVFWCYEGVMGSVSSGITCGSIWGIGITTQLTLTDMSPCGFTLRGSTGDSYGFEYGLYNLGGVLGYSCWGGSLVVGGVARGGGAMLKIAASFFKSNI